MATIKKRRKGIAILDCEKGILVVSPDNKTFILPGGGAKFLESRKSAAIRELREETGLKVIEIKYMFTDIGPDWKNNKGKWVKDYCKVFLVKTEGVPNPETEMKKIAFWKKGSKIKLGEYSKKLIERYLNEKDNFL